MLIVLFDGIAYGMLLFLISVGLSVTLGLMRFVNLAHGAFAMIGGYVLFVATARLGLSFWTGLLASFVITGVVAGLLEWLLFRRLYARGALDQVLLSIGLIFMLVAGASFVFGPTLKTIVVPAFLDGQLRVGDSEVGRYRLFMIAVGLVLTLVLGWVITRTRYGAQVRAAVDRQQTANALGIRVNRLFALTFSVGSGLAGLGGALGVNILGLDPAFPLKYLVYFLLVVCVGGAGTITGPLVAAILIGLADVAGKYYLPSMGSFVVYLVMVLMLIVRPHGLIPQKGAA